MQVALVRVDHRLVHGQVTMGWTRSVRAEALVVVSDRAADDPFEASLMRMAVPHGVTIEIWGVTEAADRVRAGNLPAGRVLLLVATPTDLLPLVAAGLSNTEINIGGVRSPGATIKLTKEVHATPDEIEAWKELAAKGIALSVQWLPDQKRRSLNAEVVRR